MLKHPMQNTLREFAILLAFPCKETDRLRGGVNVDRIDPVVVILWSAVFPKELICVVGHTLAVCG